MHRTAFPMLALKAIHLVLAGGVTLAAAGAFVAWKLLRAATRRRRELAALAEEAGLAFDARQRSSGLDNHLLFKPFRAGLSTEAGPTLEGEVTILGRACTVLMGDCRHHRPRFDDPDRTERVRFSYVLVGLPPDLEPRPPRQRRREAGIPLACAGRWCCVTDGQTLWRPEEFAGAIERIRAHVEGQFEEEAA